MKYNKNISIVCLVLMIISFALVILVPTECVKLSNIIICLFTGFLVAFIISVLGYFHEKSNVLTSIYVYLNEVHLRLFKSEKRTSDIFLKISEIKDFRNILEDIYIHLDGISISKHNRIIEFHGFWKKGKLVKCLSEILALSNSISNLIICVSKIKEVAIQYEIFKIQSQNPINYIPSADNPILKIDTDYQNKIKEMLSIIHEMEKTLLIETDRLGRELYTLYRFNVKWEDTKLNM
jgi:hypothetical protein